MDFRSVSHTLLYFPVPGKCSSENLHLRLSEFDKSERYSVENKSAARPRTFRKARIPPLVARGRQPVQSALILTHKNYPKSRIGKIPCQFLNDRKIDIAFFGLCRNPENTRIHAAVPGIQNDSIARILLRSSIRF